MQTPALPLRPPQYARFGKKPVAKPVPAILWLVRSRKEQGPDMPKIVDHDKRRSDIVAVAKRLILEGGFEAATMRSLAAEAGFANGALKHFFPNKDSIIAATFESVLEEMNPERRLADKGKADGGTPAERLHDIIAEVLPSNEKDINAGRVLLVLWDHATSNPDLAALYRAFFQTWRGVLEEHIAAAAGPKTRASGDFARLALEIMSLTIGANVVHLMHSDGVFIDSYRHLIDDYVARVVT